VLGGHDIVLRTMEELPPEASADYAAAARMGTRAALVVPFTSPQGGVRGALSVTSATHGLAWTEEALASARIVAQVINSVLARREADRAAAEERAWLRAILDSAADDLVWCVDLEGRTLIAHNRAFARYWRALGIGVRDGMATEDAFPGNPERAALWRSLYARARAEGSFSVEYASVAPGRTLVFDMNVVEREGRRLGISVFGRDETEKRRAQVDLERTREHLLHAQKTEALGRLAGGVAHDFNDLLTIICGLTEGAIADLGGGHALAADLEDALAAARRAAGLTQQLLAFSRRQPRNARVVDVGGAVRDAEKLLRRVLGGDIDLRVDVRATEPGALVDPAQVHQVVVNLAVNARDAMPSGGELGITVDEVDVTDDEPGPHALAPGRYVVVEVRDTGEGMSDDVRARALDPFFTTKQRGKGTGLGLATVLGIAQQSGGDVRIQSRLGAGTSVRVFLPKCHEGATSEPPESAVEGARGGERVLVVEDDPAVRAVVARHLRRAGYDVLAAADGPAALRIAGEQGGRFHLVLSDVVMPGMSGADLGRRLRERWPALPLLFTTGFSDVALDELEALAGVPVLPKPYSQRSLTAAVRHALDAAERARRA
jgi:signal transduction histidine kinase/ActR/RegA family two-component response regulator